MKNDTIKIIDGRNAHAVPKKTTITNTAFTQGLCTMLYDIQTRTTIYCVKLDGKYVPCTCVEGDEYRTLCGAYKTADGFNKWVKRTYPFAIGAPAQNKD